MFVGILPEQGPKLSIPLRFYILGTTHIIIALIFLIGFIYNLKPKELIFFNLFYNKTFLFYIHCFTVGYLLFIIFGSLFQIFPVVFGVKIQKVKLVNASLILVFYGILFFLYQIEIQFTYSLGIIYVVGYFILLILLFFIIPLLKRAGTNIGFLFAFFAFFSGLVVIQIYFLKLFDLIKLEISFFKLGFFHSVFMFIGFVLQLIVSMFIVILPLFYVSKPYPKKIKLFLNIFYFLVPFLFIIINLFYDNIFIFKILFFLSNLTFIYFTLKILFSRERKIRDITISFFYFALLNFFVANILLFFDIFFFFAFLFFMIFIIAVIQGMLYKIVPFLCWFHLQSYKNQMRAQNPAFPLSLFTFTMQDFTYKKLEKIQFALLLVISTIIPLMTFPSWILIVLVLVLFFFIFSLIQILYALRKYIVTYKNFQII
ncbi:MAG: O-antigen polymerase [Leptonema sp. (in: bacteria)]